ncbi:MAG: hypothetical protein RJA22_1403 [Verrucomicrobiota bacterium]
MKRLLIGYDGSPGAEAMLDDLSRAGLPAQLEVVVMAVADVWLPTNPPPGSTGFLAPESASARRAHTAARQAVEDQLAIATRAAQGLQSAHPGWRATAESSGDAPAWALVKKADAWRADLVALGSHGRSVLERLFLGSTATKVAAEAHCSVRVTRPRRHTQPGRLRVLVAVDGSPDSARAVEAVTARAWPAHAEFRVVNVLDPRMETALAWPGLFAQQFVPLADQETRDAACRILEQAAARLSAAGLKVETELLSGDPRQELLQHADRWEADTVFLGARGLHHGGRLSLGTLASGVAARAHCTVEIVRPA